VNRTVLDYTGLTSEEVMETDFRERVFHHEDLERLRETRRNGFAAGLPWENEVRVRRADDKYRWFLIRDNPLADEQGWLIRWCAAGTDINDRKQDEERLREENIALREEISRSSPYEEIVGSSMPLRRVLSQVSRVRITVAYGGQNPVPKPFVMVLLWIETSHGWKITTDIPIPVPPEPEAR